MSDTEITLVPRTLDEAKSLAKELAPAALLPGALKAKPADILAIVMTGQELGLAPMQSIRGIHLIEGRPSLSADAIAAICLRSPQCEYLRVVEFTDERVTMEAKRRNDPPVRVTFTMADAARAGLANRDNYKKYPRSMLRARATAIVCRAVFPDVLMGVYTPDEIEDEGVLDVNPRPVTVAPPRPSPVEAQVVPTPEAEPLEPGSDVEPVAVLPPEPTPSPAAETDALAEVLAAIEATPKGTKEFGALGNRVLKLLGAARATAMAAYKAKAGGQ